MTIYDRIIAALWTIIIVYWIVSGLRAKRKARGNTWWRGAWLRVVLIILAFHFLRHSGVHRFLRNLHLGDSASHPAICALGVLLCATGIAFAIWARRHLGRNWGMPMSLQEGHELVTTGPYAQVRHPIYTGILLALFGSALAQGVAWLVPFFVCLVYFIYSARTEEKLMVQQFPNVYPAYQARTKMLIPFLW